MPSLSVSVIVASAVAVGSPTWTRCALTAETSESDSTAAERMPLSFPSGPTEVTVCDPGKVHQTITAQIIPPSLMPKEPVQASTPTEPATPADPAPQQ